MASSIKCIKNCKARGAANSSISYCSTCAEGFHSRCIGATTTSPFFLCSKCVIKLSESFAVEAKLNSVVKRLEKLESELTVIKTIISTGQEPVLPNAFNSRLELLEESLGGINESLANMSVRDDSPPKSVATDQTHVKTLQNPFPVPIILDALDDIPHTNKDELHQEQRKTQPATEKSERIIYIGDNLFPNLEKRLKSINKLTVSIFNQPNLTLDDIIPLFEGVKSNLDTSATLIIQAGNHELSSKTTIESMELQLGNVLQHVGNSVKAVVVVGIFPCDLISSDEAIIANDMIKRLCRTYKCWYCDITQVFTDTKGCLKISLVEDTASQGITSITSAGVSSYANFLRFNIEMYLGFNVTQNNKQERNRKAKKRSGRNINQKRSLASECPIPSKTFPINPHNAINYNQQHHHTNIPGRPGLLPTPDNYNIESSRHSYTQSAPSCGYVPPYMISQSRQWPQVFAQQTNYPTLAPATRRNNHFNTLRSNSFLGCNQVQTNGNYQF